MKRSLVFPALVAALLATIRIALGAETLDRDVAIEGASTLRLNVSGTIRLMPTQGATAIHLHVANFGKNPPLHISSTKTGRRLTVTITGPSQSILPFVGQTGYELQVSYPRSLQMDVREFAGSVHADAITAPTQIYNANGPITVDDASSALTAEADLGDITVSNARSMVELTCGTGNATATLASGWGGNLVRMESSKGDLTLHVPSNFRANFDLTSANGNVNNAMRSTPHAPLVFMLTQEGNVAVLAGTK